MPNLQPSTSRMEAFSDGVIAVIITIIVLEFKVPRDPGFAGFLTILPTLAVYLLSFTFIGIYWVNHHHIIDRLKHVDAFILWANLGFLFCLSLLPFFTSNVIEKNLDSFSVSAYAASLFVIGVAFTVLGSAVIRHLRGIARLETPLQDHTDAQHEAAAQRAEQSKGLLSLSMYGMAIPLAYWKPAAALALIALVTLLWIIPNFGVRQPNEPR